MEVDTTGMPGETTASMVNRIVFEIDRGRKKHINKNDNNSNDNNNSNNNSNSNSNPYGLVVVLGGSNDLLYADPEYILGNIKLIHDKIRTKRIGINNDKNQYSNKDCNNNNNNDNNDNNGNAGFSFTSVLVTLPPPKQVLL